MLQKVIQFFLGIRYETNVDVSFFLIFWSFQKKLAYLNRAPYPFAVDSLFRDPVRMRKSRDDRSASGRAVPEGPHWDTDTDIRRDVFS